MSEEKLTRAAIVTGGSRGIGRAVCVALAKQGCNVVVNYCHGAEPAEQTAALCRAEGVQAVTVQADVSVSYTHLVKTPFLERELLEEYAQQIGLE